MANTERFEAGTVELGDTVLLLGQWRRITGWYIDGHGKAVLEADGRWWRFSRFELLERRKT